MELNGASLVGRSNADTMTVLRQALKSRGSAPSTIDVVVARRRSPACDSGTGQRSRSGDLQEDHLHNLLEDKKAGESEMDAIMCIKEAPRNDTSSDVSFYLFVLEEFRPSCCLILA